MIKNDTLFYFIKLNISLLNFDSFKLDPKDFLCQLESSTLRPSKLQAKIPEEFIVSSGNKDVLTKVGDWKHYVQSTANASYN